MKKNIVGIIVATNKTELGGEKAAQLQADLSSALKRNQIEFVLADKVVWDAADALNVTNALNAKGVSLIALIHACWLKDDIQYLIYHNSNCPIVLLSVPAIETFSMASVQHFASELSRSNLFFRTISSPLNSDETAVSLRTILQGISAARTIQKSVIGLIGPRQTWRTAGAQDLTCDEWDLTQKLGALVVHIENSEWRETIEAQSDEDAYQILTALKNDRRFHIAVTDQHLLYNCKSYLAIKALIQKYNLTCAAAQCYPEFGGMSNLAACLLADEGFVLDTEGDISHALIMSALNAIDDKASVLCEWGTVDEASGTIYLTHEGSSALSRMPAEHQAYMQECGDGVMIGFSLEGTEELTVIDFSGQFGDYRTVSFQATLTGCPQTVFQENCKRLTVAIKSSFAPTQLYNRLIANGSDHHFILKSGNLTGEIAVMNDLLCIGSCTL